MDEISKIMNKGRIVFLYLYLVERADQEHPVMRDEILAAYAEKGYQVSKNTFTDDIRVFAQAGIPVKTVAIGKANGYYLERSFDAAELRALIDAVSFAQFFTVQKSDQLIRKIASLAPAPVRKDLTSKVYAQGRRKTGSNNVNTAITTILKAIHEKRQISFLYVDYDINKKLVFRNDGNKYTVSPYALILDNNRYYVPAYNPARETVVKFRIDRMRSVTEENIPAEKTEEFNLEQYIKENIGMHSDECEAKKVILRCESSHMSSIVDFFGEDVETAPEQDGEHFRAYVQVRPGRTFFSWVTGFAGEVAILGPEEVKKNYMDFLHALLKAQGEE